MFLKLSLWLSFQTNTIVYNIIEYSIYAEFIAKSIGTLTMGKTLLSLNYLGVLLTRNVQ